MACKIETTFCKGRGEVLDYQIDWSDYLSSETISSSTWSASNGITIDSSTKTTTATTVWLSGGTVGGFYTVTNTIVTSEARTAQRAFYIQLTKR